MDRSRTDRILAAWEEAARTLPRPATAPRRSAASFGFGVAPVVGVGLVVLVAVIAAGILGRSTENVGVDGGLVSPAPRAAPGKSAAPSPSWVLDALGSLTFRHPASWQKVVANGAVLPGPLMWLISVPVSQSCLIAPAPDFPTGCLSGGALPEGGLVITFGSGAVVVSPASTPVPVSTYHSDACAVLGGTAMSSRIWATWIEACVRGEGARAAFTEFVSTLRVTGLAPGVSSSPSP